MGELGRYLVAGREKTGMSPEQLARVTRIPVRTLAALEAGSWDDLPEPVFVRGFIVAYCRAVHLDEGPALDMLSEGVRCRREVTGAARPQPEGPSDLLVGSRRASGPNWTYLAIVLVFVIGILVALLTVGTGGGQGDVSRAVPAPRLNWDAGREPPPGR